MVYISDWRIYNCKDCGQKIKIDVNNENDKEVIDYWEEYHSNCRKRIQEEGIIKAMNLKNKSLLPYLYMIDNSTKQSDKI